MGAFRMIGDTVVSKAAYAVNGHRSLLDCGLPKFPNWQVLQCPVISRCCDREWPSLVDGRAAWEQAEVQ
jgi:hypothetical protein